MGKVNVSKVLEEMRALYAKGKKEVTVCAGSEVKSVYTLKDVIPMPPDHPLVKLSGLPGLPYNKIIQVAGKADSGKSTLAAECMVAAQKAGAQVILWDTETKFDSARFVKMGGVAEDLMVIQVNNILKGAEELRNLIHLTKKHSPQSKILAVWDSVGGSLSRSHAERELDDEKHSAPGTDARENSQVMKAIVSLINEYPDSIAVYMANQTYAKIGFMQKGDAAAGGAKIEYHSSLIVFLKRVKTLTKVTKGSTVKVGIVTQATASKNHLTQGDTSLHQLQFTVSSNGTQLTESTEDLGEESDG